MSSLITENTNIRNDIEKRLTEYEQNPLGLPDKAPLGSKPRESREGHMNVIRDLQARLAELENRYSAECGGEPENSPNPEQSMSNILPLVGLGLGIGACALAPEICIPTVMICGVAAR